MYSQLMEQLYSVINKSLVEDNCALCLGKVGCLLAEADGKCRGRSSKRGPSVP